MLDVMFYEVFEEERQALEKVIPKEIKCGFTYKTIQEQGDEKPQADVISIRTQSQIPSEWEPKLKAVLTRSQGFDHLAHLDSGISCGFLGEYCSRSVAEHAVMSMLVLMKKLKKQIHNFDSFNRNQITGADCFARSALVVGVGNIGGEIVNILKGLKMDVRGVDIDPKHKDLEYISLKDGIPLADVVFCALPLTEETEGVLNYDVFNKSKPGVIFINISRGEISPVGDLKKLLDENHLGGLSMDVFEDEKDLAEHLRDGVKDTTQTTKKVMSLKNWDNVLLTPHNAFNTEESVQKKALLSAEAITAFVKNGAFPNPVPTK